MNQLISLLLAIPLQIFSFAPIEVFSLSSNHRIELRDLAASVIIHRKTIVKGKDNEQRREFITCSGTYITPYTILTAAHCFDGAAGSTWARGPYNTVGYPVHIVYWDKKADLAILDAPFGHPYVKIGKLPNWGDTVVNIGSPFDFEFVQSEGKVGPVAYHPLGNVFSSDYLITTAMANPGSSGGGAFNTRGELVGVNTMVMGTFGWTGITMAVNSPTIKVFLVQAFKNYKHYGGN